jgi:hypothetical protein
MLSFYFLHQPQRLEYIMDNKRQNTGFIMKNHWCHIVLAFMVMLILSAACSSAPTTAPSSLPSTTSQDGATLVQERCAVCHPLTFVERSRHTSSDWQIIVSMMISRGAQLTPQEEATVVSWLAANFGQ